MLRSADDVWGGFGTAPKFPAPANLEFLLGRAARADEPEQPAIRAMLERTLWGMASGGMYDQIGGGFARYSVDVQWLVPHFEKMLYDNAALARVYLHAFQLFGDPAHERVVRETLGYLEREMLHQDGGFYSAQDADSEGIEGKFFLWTTGQIESLLGKTRKPSARSSASPPRATSTTPTTPSSSAATSSPAAPTPSPAPTPPLSASRVGGAPSSRLAPSVSRPRPTTRC